MISEFILIKLRKFHKFPALTRSLHGYVYILHGIVNIIKYMIQHGHAYYIKTANENTFSSLHWPFSLVLKDPRLKHGIELITLSLPPCL